MIKFKLAKSHFCFGPTFLRSQTRSPQLKLWVLLNPHFQLIPITNTTYIRFPWLYHKLPQTWLLKRTEMYLLQFWREQVQDQHVGRAGPRLKSLGVICSSPLPASSHFDCSSGCWLITPISASVATLLPPLLLCQIFLCLSLMRTLGKVFSKH